MAETEAGPDTPSQSYLAMSPYWTMVDTILAGAVAMRAAGELYLPKLPGEDSVDYAYRRDTSPFTNIFAEVVRNLASKPFTKPVTLKDGAPDRIAGALDAEGKQRRGGYVDDIDGQGNNLHVFASHVFKAGIAFAIDWILVDYTKAMPGNVARPLTIEEEDKQGLRPYWVRVPAARMIAAYSDQVGGQRVFTHCRILEPTLIREGFAETTVKRVRVFDRQRVEATADAPASYLPATWELWELRTVTGSSEPRWVQIEGPLPVDIGVIPIVPFVTGPRTGDTWVIEPPLRDIANQQIDEWREESNLHAIKEQTCFPMLAGNGIPVPLDKNGQKIKVPVGPRAVLFAPPNSSGNHGSWDWIKPDADAIRALMEHLDKTREEMREAGMQPMKAANQTVVNTANVAIKASSAVQAWAWGLKDALEQAFRFTSMWLNEAAETVVIVHTDFTAGVDDSGELDSLIKLRATGDLSRPSIIDEFRRRNVLGETFDALKNEREIDEEGSSAAGAGDEFVDDDPDDPTDPADPVDPDGADDPDADPLAPKKPALAA